MYCINYIYCVYSTIFNFNIHNKVIRAILINNNKKNKINLINSPL